MDQLCKQLEDKQSGLNLSFHQILYYSPTDEAYIYAGLYNKETGKVKKTEGMSKAKEKKQVKDALSKKKLAMKVPIGRLESAGVNELNIDEKKEDEYKEPSNIYEGKVFKIFIEDKNENKEQEEEADESKEYIEKGGDVKIPIISNKIRLKYRPISNEDLYLCFAEFKEKTRRGKERTIKEAIDLVKRWKEHQRPSGDQQKVSLEEAADRVKTSKKTLDDYYRQLKTGFKAGFDFSYYRDYPIGILRHFNSQRRQGTNKAKPLKIPKTE